MKEKEINSKKLKRARTNLYLEMLVLDFLVVLFTYFLMPVVQNFPPLGENLAFQQLVQPLTHVQQYLIVFIIGLLVHYIILRVLFRNVVKYIKKYIKGEKISHKEIYQIRKACQNIPYKTLFIQLLVFIPLGILFNLIMLVQLVAIIKFTLMVIALTAIVSVLTFIITQTYLTNVLMSTYNLVQDYKNNVGYKVNNTTSLMLQVMPFIAVILIVVSLVGYSKAIDQKSLTNASHYKAHLQNAEIEIKDVNKDSLIEKMNRIPLNDKKDFFIIMKENEVLYISTADGNISDFPLSYRDYFFPNFEEGILYENFGVDEELYMSKLTDEEGINWYIAFKYNTTDQDLLIYYSQIIVALFLLFLIILYVWARNHSIHLRRVTHNLQSILESEYIEKDSIVPILSNDEIGDLSFYYNKIQQKLIEQQDVIKQQGQLVSLGQMIGGIAHNLKTPILSIAGAAEGIKYLAEEMEESLTTPTVTIEDKKEILEEQEEWVEKIKVHLEYMNDIITAVKGQATTFTTEREERFTVKDLFKNVDMLTAHEFKNALIELEIINNVPNNKYIKGDFNSLLQIINNIVVNAIQAYDEKTKGKVQLIANIGDLSENLVISVRDQGKGMSQDVQEKVFKQMVTTKGKYGTGLGLYMSYSTIKGKFQGEIKFESEEGKGTTFHVILPSIEKREEILNGNTYRSKQSSIGGKSEIEQTASARVDVYHKEAQEAVEKFNQEHEKESSKKTTSANNNVKNPKTINKNKTNSKEKNKTKSKDQNKTKK